eukprot:5677782-Amphidinium_carterae.2
MKQREEGNNGAYDRNTRHNNHQTMFDGMLLFKSVQYCQQTTQGPGAYVEADFQGRLGTRDWSPHEQAKHAHGMTQD